MANCRSRRRGCGLGVVTLRRDPEANSENGTTVIAVGPQHACEPVLGRRERTVSKEHSDEAALSCGCRVASDAGTGGVPTIIFCPVHAAAPRLLAALEGILPWLERGRERFDREQARALTQALKAVREATREA